MADSSRRRSGSPRGARRSDSATDTATAAATSGAATDGPGAPGAAVDGGAVDDAAVGGGAVEDGDAAFGITTPAVPGRRERRALAREEKGDRPPGMSPPWVPALMVTCFLLGLVWLVVYYLAGQSVPGMSALGNWNLLVGIGVIAVGFVVSTQWR